MAIFRHLFAGAEQDAGGDDPFAPGSLFAFRTSPANREVLRDCVLWFNRADEAGGGVIETEEREDIAAALEETAWAAGHKSLVEEIDAWREW